MIEIVTWRDAHFQLEEPEDGWEDDFLCQTVGWVETDDKWVTVVGEQTPNGPRQITRIPLGMVVRRAVVLASNPDAPEKPWSHEEFPS